MDPRDLVGCPTSLMRMVLEPNPSTERLERDLNVVMNELRRQVTLTASLRNDWYNLMHSTTLGKMETAERLQILSRFCWTHISLRNAIYVLGLASSSLITYTNSNRKRSAKTYLLAVADTTRRHV
ncbi:unnamed protein product [Heligmosomoides polygyrus]|uniref:Uncharacterized protein n=1 Tax=Heligmosomoides polygyrus TaxID=6339 RepID=A0A183FKE0_HELPZ|nr:unnamed protein product [Heligmosomoides polygyrus]